MAALSVALTLPVAPATAATQSAGPRGMSLTAVSVGSAVNGGRGGVSVTIQRDKRGHVRYIGAAGGRVLVRGADRAQSPAAAALRNLRVYADDFGVSAPSRDLRTASVQALAQGQSVVRFQQSADGLPVFGGQLTTVLDSENNLLSVNGETSTAVTSSTYTVLAGQARAAALKATGTKHALRPGQLHTTPPQRWLYDASLFKDGAPAGARGVWRIEVMARDYLGVRDLVLVDGLTGRVVANINEISHAKRVVCDNLNQKANDYVCDKPRYARTEAGPASKVADVNKAFDNAGEASDFYRTNFGVNLTTLIGSDYGDGTKLRSTVRFCPTGVHCPFANAFWDGAQMVYGKGFSVADDVVGHELTHGVTQHTSGLVSWYQSGAINESMSDVFGELIDKSNGVDDDSNWDLGEDLPGAPVRNMKDPTLHNQPAILGGPNWSSSAVDSGEVHHNDGVGNKAAFLIADGTGAGTFNGQTMPGLGTAKTAQIYWGAENLLTPGSDYADLASALHASCNDLVGRTTPAPVITLDDCTGTVDQATLATAMQSPTHLAPSEPRSVLMTGGYTTIRIRWSAPASAGTMPISSYVVTVSPAIEGETALTIDNPSARDITIGGVPADHTFTFGLMAVSADGTSPTVKRILQGTRVILTTDSSVPYQREAVLTARVTTASGAPVVGRSVILYRKVTGKLSYRALGTLATNSGGSVTFRHKQKHPSTYYALFPSGASSLLGSRSTKQLVTIRHRVSLHVDDLSVHIGQTVDFTGRIRPNDRGTVIVQRRRATGGDWKKFATVAVRSTGHYDLIWTPTTGRDFEWRVKVKKTAAYDKGLSKIRLVQVT